LKENVFARTGNHTIQEMISS
jgi:hypothetical protein